MTDAATPPVTLLIPVYDDWEALAALLPQLARALGPDAAATEIVVVDDSSRETGDPMKLEAAGRSFRAIDLVRLRRNLGHQRAIAVGLAYVGDTSPESTVVVMDGDGEDDPADVPRLLGECARLRHQSVVFAERTKRSESVLFQIGYHSYRHLHRLLTGIPVRVGNFSAIPASCLRQLLAAPELWNHFAAAVFKAKVPRTSVPSVRIGRLAGGSKMNVVALAIHGLSAISVFAEIVAVRVILATAALSAAIALGLVATLGWMLWQHGRVGPSFVTAAWVGSIFLTQAWGFAAMLVFLILANRQTALFLPLRDCQGFVSSATRLAPHPPSGSP